MAKKFYVVWKGRNPGVYDNWEDALEQVREFPGASYKGFSSSAEAAAAFRRGATSEDTRQLANILLGGNSRSDEREYMLIPEIDLRGWAVDASCLGNPGVMEYRCVDLMTGNEVFHGGPYPQGTNNIGEFLGIVHALALMAQRGETHTLYSDSAIAIKWVRNRVLKTKLAPNEKNARLFQVMARALAWVRTHDWNVPILKWQTDIWGEIPADFGRK